MIDSLALFEVLSKSMGEETARLLSQTLTQMYDELSGRLTKEDFTKGQNRTDEALRALAEAQQRTEARVGELAEAQHRTEANVAGLAKAQERTDARLESLARSVQRLAEAQERTESKVGELAKAQERTDAHLESLAQSVEVLAEAQQRTEAKVADLAKAQERTDARLESLAQSVQELSVAHRETERSLQRLEVRFDEMIAEFADTRRQLGGLSDAVGYGLENSVFPYLRSFARREFGIELSRYDRRNIEYPDGRFDEINIYGEGTRDGEAVILLGEAKSQPSRRDVDAFAARIVRVGAHMKRPVIGFIVGHTFAPEVDHYLVATHPEITQVNSYRFEVSYTREVPPAE